MASNTKLEDSCPSNGPLWSRNLFKEKHGRSLSETNEQERNVRLIFMLYLFDVLLEPLVGFIDRETCNPEELLSSRRFPSLQRLDCAVPHISVSTSDNSVQRRCMISSSCTKPGVPRCEIAGHVLGHFLCSCRPRSLSEH